MAKDCGNLRGIDGATAILVEESECSPHVVFVEELVGADGGRAPLAEVKFAIIVRVGLREDFHGALIDLFFRRVIVSGVEGTISLEELVALDHTITILVKLVEAVAQLLHLFLGRKMARHEGQRCLL